MIDDQIIQAVREDWRTAPRGMKTDVIRRWCGALGCSYNLLYSRLDIGQCRQGARQIDGIEAIAATIATIKKTPPAGRGELATEDAVDIAIANGLLPHSDFHLSTIDRVIRETGLNKQRRRIQRFQAEFPNQLHHVDASTSSCFFISRPVQDESGNVVDYVLKLHKGSFLAYKNKPIPIGVRPWIYGLVDDHSGLHVGRYVAAIGESFLDNLDFLVWAWARIGLPDLLKGDHGPMMKRFLCTELGESFLGRLGVRIDPSMPGNKEAHGKIERPWRTAWNRFEMPYFVENMRTYEITMSDLNARFARYEDGYNCRPHRFDKHLTRRQAWQRVNLRGGIVTIPEDTLSRVAERHERQVRQDGTFSLDNHLYEVRGLHDADVYVYRGVLDGRLIVQNKKTGDRFDVEDFRPNPVGKFRASKKTPHDRAVEAAQDMNFRNTLYQEDTDMGNLVTFPTRVAGDREMPDLFAMDAYPNIDAALRDFVVMTGASPTGDERGELIELITNNGMSRDFVRELAGDVVMMGGSNHG